MRTPPPYTYHMYTTLLLIHGVLPVSYTYIPHAIHDVHRYIPHAIHDVPPIMSHTQIRDLRWGIHEAPKQKECGFGTHQQSYHNNLDLPYRCVGLYMLGFCFYILLPCCYLRETALLMHVMHTISQHTSMHTRTPYTSIHPVQPTPPPPTLPPPTPPPPTKPTQMIFFDTEGFESTGKADAYDDRIFALSALVSSLLIYNLPETIRESDLEKLSFATELAEALFEAPGGDDGGMMGAGMGDPNGGGGMLNTRNLRGGGESSDTLRAGGAFAGTNMLWVIQRDFLQGKTPQAMLSEAMEPVANPTQDKGVVQVNRVRRSLRRLVVNSTAVGLRQPHLERTRLCELADEQLDPVYVQQRDALRLLVRSMAQPKVCSWMGGWVGGEGGRGCCGVVLFDLCVAMCIQSHTSTMHTSPLHTHLHQTGCQWWYSQWCTVGRHHNQGGRGSQQQRHAYWEFTGGIL